MKGAAYQELDGTEGRFRRASLPSADVPSPLMLLALQPIFSVCKPLFFRGEHLSSFLRRASFGNELAEQSLARPLQGCRVTVFF